MSDTSKLNYISYLIIKAFKENGLDEVYIDSKIKEFECYNNKYESLSWAINQLDANNLMTFANLIGVTIEQLITTAKVFSKI